ncbi:response regulator [Alkalicoccobacillus gibsonii]|jgi:two-component system, CitB family, response regulator MalR|uniref:response regulator n=1 Tax=Alkalicoccobacillus gibsonii TaxID=79881 RepID=UPI0019330EB3|nr:response regulator [Alkalicoccobacillus gibsonii]MBM0065735.1 response regulator [Alkalicoccobacillus gibsonii]
MINVLIVEDDPMVAKFNRIYLEQISGFSLIGTASSIKEAWEIIEEQEVELILLDLYVNNENGLDLVSELRAKRIETDVIVVSSANDQSSIQTALRYGAVDYLMKPFDFDRFKEALLQYADQFNQLKAEALKQEQVDQLFLNRSKEPIGEQEELPKGITKPTYKKVFQEINQLSGWFSTAELSDASAISRVSLRKYLRYLEEQGMVESRVSYEGTGRPLNQFRLSQKGNEYFMSLLSE